MEEKMIKFKVGSRVALICDFVYENGKVVRYYSKIF